MENTSLAPGWPRIEPRWTSSAKSGVGTSLGGRVWFSISHGILNEIYYPRIDQACVRDFGFLVVGPDFVAEEKRETAEALSWSSPGVPAFQLVNTCRQGRFTIEKKIVADPRRDAVLQRVKLRLSGDLSEHSLFGLIGPHLGDAGQHNTAWLGSYKGHEMLFAQRDGIALAVASSHGWVGRSVGFVGVSDGWQDLHQHRRQTWHYERAEDGNVAMMGELAMDVGEVDVAVGFGRTSNEAAHRALGALLQGFDAAWETTTSQWQAWQDRLLPLGLSPEHEEFYRVSTAVLRSHESSRFPGGLIASLSIPWGASKGDGDLGGYHLVWPRDLVESAGGLLAAGAHSDVLRVLRYLHVTQEDDGHWPQNMWLDGTPYWSGIQMDETGFPILLVELAHRQGILDERMLEQLWPMVRAAAGFIVRNGPVTQQDRWEEDGGYSPFTLAVEIAALVCAAGFAQKFEPEVAEYLRRVADAWEADIDRWTYVRNTEISRANDVDGYYVRIAAANAAGDDSLGTIAIKNRRRDHSTAQIQDVVSPDALALVRFGLRKADDPRITNTVAVIDARLRVELPQGPVWKRYDEDGYGEHEDGSPFDGTGIGRPWPLLTGERAHFELALGRREAAQQLLATMCASAGSGRLIPEQVWDGDDVPGQELFKGKATGSAMPLVWAHAEHIKLLRSLSEGFVFDTPMPVREHFETPRPTPWILWRFNHKLRSSFGRPIRIETLAPAILHWTVDGWKTSTNSELTATTLGNYGFNVTPTPGATELEFTFYWPTSDRWEGTNFKIRLAEVES
ncbi:MAG: glycoside hydrolase family 15 protein [bacterium]